MMALAVVHDERVERVASLCVYAIDPRREHAHAAELTTILVRNDVVGVVRARPVVEEFTDGFALERLARQRTVTPVGAPVA